MKSIPPHWRASLVLTPIVLVTARSGNSDWLLAAIVTISAYIAMGGCRAGLGPGSIRARASRLRRHVVTVPFLVSAFMDNNVGKYPDLADWFFWRNCHGVRQNSGFNPASPRGCRLVSVARK